VQCFVLLIVAVLVLTTTDIFCFKKKQMDQIKKHTHNQDGQKIKKSSAHFNLTNSTHETAVVRQLWVLLVAFVWC